VGRRVLQLLAHFDVQVLLYDPYVTAEEARSLGAEKVELDELFARSDIVSVHAPALPETRHLVNAARLALMKDGAVLINTARGALVDEAALVEELRRRRLWACLDVTDPEPPPPGSPLLSCPNLTLTPHLAGSIGRARARLGALAAEELRRFFAGEPPLYQVTQEMLSRMA
jgi:phosphoglycerate dehydrogenase-like enzyme